MSFIEVGFDSLLLTQVALNCKKEFGLPVSFRQLNETYNSLDLLAGYLHENLPEEKFNDEHKPAGDPSSIEYLSRQIEQLANQVALLQSGNLPSTVPARRNQRQPNPANSHLPTASLFLKMKIWVQNPGATARIENNQQH
jgi:hypothetical protein